MLAIWSLVPLPFLKPAWTSGSSRFTYCWSLAWRILSISLLECEMSAIVQYCEHSLALPFFGIRMKTDLFQSCGHCWVFQICWHIECNTLTASSFRIWNSSTGIPSPPLALFVVMLPKAHLTLQSLIVELVCERKGTINLRSYLWRSKGAIKILNIYLFSLRCNPLKGYDIYYRPHIKCSQIWISVCVLEGPNYDLKIIVIS